MSTIFVSYRRDDSSGHAGRLYDRLSDSFGKEKLFRDVEQIKYGEDFVEAIENAVGSCKALVAIIGPNWITVKDKHGKCRLESPYDFVRLEIESALSRGIPIFPVLVSGAEMPNAEDLPESMSGLARRQALEISETRYEYDVGQMVEALGPHVGLTSIPSARESTLRPNQEMAYESKRRDSLELSHELQDVALPPSVKDKLSTLEGSTQLRFLDVYRQQEKSVVIAYLLLVFPLPFLGLHNSYLRSKKRQLAFWLVSGLLLVFAIMFHPNSVVAMFVWPSIDVFLLRTMVRKCNELIAQEIVFGDGENLAGAGTLGRHPFIEEMFNEGETK